MRSHCIITGTGRAGTTFLVQLFTELGLDTGFTTDTMHLDPVANAGLELDIMSDKAPYIVKSPWLCDNIAEVLKARTINHAIIPMRELSAAAASRARVHKAYGFLGKFFTVPGGLVHTFSSTKQEEILALQFTHLVEILVANDVPITFLSFPRFTGDAQYLYRRLEFLLKEIPYDTFLAAFNKYVRPELIHEFDTEGAG